MLNSFNGEKEPAKESNQKKTPDIRAKLEKIGSLEPNRRQKIIDELRKLTK